MRKKQQNQKELVKKINHQANLNLGERLLTVNEYSILSHCYLGYVYTLVSSGKLKSKLIDGRRYIIVEDALEFTCGFNTRRKPVKTKAKKNGSKAKVIQIFGKKGNSEMALAI